MQWMEFHPTRLFSYISISSVTVVGPLDTVGYALADGANDGVMLGEDWVLPPGLPERVGVVLGDEVVGELVGAHDI